MTKDEKLHYGNLAKFGCVLCFQQGYGEGTPAEIHHIRTNAGLRKDSPVIPLCREHHRGDTGIHMLGRNEFYNMYGISEDDLLAIANDAVNYKWEAFDGVYLGIRLQ